MLIAMYKTTEPTKNNRCEPQWVTKYAFLTITYELHLFLAVSGKLVK